MSGTKSSGNRVTVPIYQKMFDSYAEHRSISQAATDAGVGMETARKYIVDGSRGLPSIANRVDVVLKKQFKIEEDQLAYERAIGAAGRRKVLKEVAEVLPTVKLVPKGKPVTDENGKLVTHNGRPVVEVDEKTMASIVTTMRNLSSWAEAEEKAVNGVQDQVPSIGRFNQINVNTTDPTSIAEIAREVIIKSGISSNKGREDEAGIIEVVASEARAREGTTEPVTEED
jgi:hypothetical protein